MLTVFGLIEWDTFLLPERIKDNRPVISLDGPAATISACLATCHGFLIISLYFWPWTYVFNAQGISMTLTNCFRQAIDFLIIRIRLIPDKSVGQVWWGRKPLLEESPNDGYHQMDLHEVKWYDGLGHGDLKNWLVPRGSGTQVRKLQIRSWNRGFFMQDLGLKEARASSWHHGCPNWEDTVNRTQRSTENGTQQRHYPQITSELLSYPIIINSSVASLMFSSKKHLLS